jgi:hypothetical protein
LACASTRGNGGVARYTLAMLGWPKRTGTVLPALAAAIAAGYLVTTVAASRFLGVVVVVAAVTLAASVLLDRPTRALRCVIAGIAIWLAVALAGSWLLRASPGTGAGWVLLVLYLVPLIVIPWLYAATFAHPGPDRGADLTGQPGDAKADTP